VNNGVHFVEEEPIAISSIVRLLSASKNQSESVWENDATSV
jgi:hypothetical protein